MDLGQRGDGAGGRSPVPSALTAVCAGGRCAKVRHQRPRTGPSGAWGFAVSGRLGHAPSRAGRESRRIRPSVVRRQLTVVAIASCAVRS
ncbi:hypothetical protein SBD_6711 [Streptomyces bottropensis ATCC 25435]|uniref:Uncharacterized protein n=1 Tax=Streptomyces bottropensis ATCC 25435 TaxID=1054862 RepID=M3FJH7_9ACTN|nr:hypothetical protein SBD_6711 [Streptomyces bottropensis ATCC 25435]